MGLDYYLISLPKDVDPNRDENTGSLQTKLLYARKSWELVDALNASTTALYSPVSRKDFESLIEKLTVFYRYYDMIIDAYEKENPNAYERIMLEEFESWYDKSFSEYPQLGFPFEIRTYQNWVEEADKVFAAFENPNLKVWQLVS